ncbi:unnamed protein product, partial [marine sediment metagenome]
VGITMRGEFILKDIVKEVKLKTSGAKINPDYRFVIRQENLEKDILFDGDYSVGSETGFLNQWMGYGRSKQTRIIEDATDTIIEVEPAPLISHTNKLDRAVESGVRTAQFGLLNDNVHENYWKAYYQNKTNLVIFGSTKIAISFQLGMVPISIMDLIIYKDEDIDITKGGNPSKGSQSYEYSGLYFVTKVGRTITSRNISTTVELNREALGQIQGDKLK